MGSGDDLAPVWCQAIAWGKDDLLSIGPGGTNFMNLNQIKTFSFVNMYLNMSAK